MNNYLLLILGMTMVTYIPRLLPFVMMSKINIPRKLQQFLKYIPCTVLGALIIPGIFTATPTMPVASLGGAVFALIYAWHGGGIIVPVLGAIVVAFLILSL